MQIRCYLTADNKTDVLIGEDFVWSRLVSPSEDGWLEQDTDPSPGALLGPALPYATQGQKGSAWDGWDRSESHHVNTHRASVICSAANGLQMSLDEPGHCETWLQSFTGKTWRVDSQNLMVTFRKWLKKQIVTFYSSWMGLLTVAKRFKVSKAFRSNYFMFPLIDRCSDSDRRIPPPGFRYKSLKCNQVVKNLKHVGRSGIWGNVKFCPKVADSFKIIVKGLFPLNKFLQWFSGKFPVITVINASTSRQYIWGRKS